MFEYFVLLFFNDQARDVNTDTLEGGISAQLSVGPDGENISALIVKEGMDDTAQNDQTAIEASLFIPAGVFAALPGIKTRLVVTSYSDSSLFVDGELIEFNQNRSDFNRTFNSRIIAASLNNTAMLNLAEPVRASFLPLLPVSIHLSGRWGGQWQAQGTIAPTMNAEPTPTLILIPPPPGGGNSLQLSLRHG